MWSVSLYLRCPSFQAKLLSVHKRREGREVKGLQTALLNSFTSSVSFLQWKLDFPFGRTKKNCQKTLKVALWVVCEKGLDISFKCLLSVPVSVTFLGCCSWNTLYSMSLLITSQIFAKTGISQKGTVFDQIFPLFSLINDIKLMKLFNVHLSKLIWSTIILGFEMTLFTLKILKYRKWYVW